MSHETPRPGDDFENSAGEFIKFLSDPNRSKRMVDGAYENDVERERALLAVHAALKGTTIDCDTCEGVCEHQAIKIRDAFMERARELTAVMSTGLRLYQECRDYDTDVPTPIINKVYAAWSELAILFDHLEPQNHLPHVDDSEATEDDVADEEGEDG